MVGMFHVRVFAHLLLNFCLSLTRLLEYGYYYCRMPLPSTSPSRAGTRVRRRTCNKCSWYVLLCVYPLDVSLSLDSAHSTEKHATAVECLCLQPKPEDAVVRGQRCHLLPVRLQGHQLECRFAARLWPMHSVVRTSGGTEVMTGCYIYNVAVWVV